MEQEQQLNWFPGHMMKAIRQIETKLPIIDVVIEILDARAPKTSRSLVLEKMIAHKTRIVVLNKADLADEAATDKWAKEFEKENIKVLLTRALTTKLKPEIINIINLALAPKILHQQSRGIKHAQIKVLIIGLPNVGKSTFINNLLQKKITKTANTPGVTRGQQWIKLNQTIDLLDTPGILPPKVDSEHDKLILSVIKCLPFKHLFLDDIAYFVLSFLMKNYGKLLLDHYGIPFDVSKINNESLNSYFTLIAEKYHFKLEENQPNLHRAMNLIVNDLQSGKLGKVSFEKPGDK